MLKPVDSYNIQKMLPYIAGIIVVFGIVGLMWREREIWGALLAGLASILIWVLSYVHVDLQDQQRLENIKKLFWTELSSLALTVVDEAKWWEERCQEISEHQARVNNGSSTVFIKTELRIFSHLDLVVIKANLITISQINIVAADSIVKCLGLVRAIHVAGPEFFAAEDRIAENLEQEGIAAAIERQLLNALKLAISLKHLCVELVVASELIDRDGAYRAEQQAVITEQERQQQKEDFDLISIWRDKWGTR